MASERWILVAIIALNTLVFCFLAFLAWRRKYSSVGQAFFTAVILIVIYSFAYMCELASDTIEGVRFWLRIESVGYAFLPSAWIMLAVSHTNAKSKYWPQWQSFLLMLSTITLVLSNTSEFHRLYYVSLQLNSEAPFPVANFVPGLWYWAHIIFINTSILFGNILYASAWRKAPRAKRQQAFVLFLGSLFPWCVFIAYLLKVIPWGLDPTPIALLVPGILYAWAIFSLKMLEVAPIARQAVFHKLSDGVLVFDQEGRLADLNAACNHVFPNLSARTKGQDGCKLFRENAIMLDLLAQPANEIKTMWFEASGEKVNYQLERIELYDGEGYRVGFMIIMRDITQFSMIIEGLQLQASVDPLTKAWNRNRWQEICQTLIIQSHQTQDSFSLIIVDMDDFKHINDTYGHLAGDAVLREFALTSREILRTQDIIGRYGGDEFVIILPGLKNVEAVEIAERLRRAVESMTVMVGEQSIRVTASFGVVSKEEDFSSIEQLIQKADEALYKVKKGGGNSVVGN